MQSNLQNSRPLSATNTTKQLTMAKKIIPPKVLEAVKAREEELTNDPHAQYVDAHNVWCLLCDRNIKLSSKSLFDLSHWKEHRLKKHGIRQSSMSNVKNQHTTRLLVEETKEKMKLRKPSAPTRKKSVRNQLATTQLRKYPSPSSSDTSSESSRSGKAPRRSARSHPPSHRFNPLTSVRNNANGSSSRPRSLRQRSSPQGYSQAAATPPLSRHSARESDRAESSPLSSVPRSLASSTSSLTSLSSSDTSFSSLGEDPINPLPVLPDFRLPSEIMDYLRFARWPPQIDGTIPETNSSGSFPCWSDWSWSMLNSPRWSTCEDEDKDGEDKPQRSLDFLRDDPKRATVPECIMDEDDPHLRPTGVGYMFFEESHLVPHQT